MRSGNILLRSRSLIYCVFFFVCAPGINHSLVAFINLGTPRRSSKSFSCKKVKYFSNCVHKYQLYACLALHYMWYMLLVKRLKKKYVLPANNESIILCQTNGNKRCGWPNFIRILYSHTKIYFFNTFVVFFPVRFEKGGSQILIYLFWFKAWFRMYLHIMYTFDAIFFIFYLLSIYEVFFFCCVYGGRF